MYEGMRSTKSSMDAVDCPEVLQGLWRGLVAILSSTPLVPPLNYGLSLASALQSMGGED